MPKQNLYRRLAELLDWDFLYQQTQSLYSHTGQPSLDPVVFFKLMLVSRLENLVSDRRLIEHYSLRLDSRYFPTSNHSCSTYYTAGILPNQVFIKEEGGALHPAGTGVVKCGGAVTQARFCGVASSGLLTPALR